MPKKTPKPETSSAPAVPVTGLFTSLETTTRSQLPVNLSQLLQAAVGKNVTLITGGENQPPIRGKLLRVTRAEPPQPPSPYVMSPHPDESVNRNTPPTILRRSRWCKPTAASPP
ncbi:MAG: hypothetical protein WC058_08575 [Phycisphaeraceae bacterium]